MRKTEQYELNQWELSDRVRMEDFNADNAKLEAALAGKTGRLEKIYTVDEAQYDGKDAVGAYFGFGVTRQWEDWECVIIFQDLHKTPFQQDDILQILFDGELEDGGDWGHLVDRFIVNADSLVLVLFPMHDGSNPIRGFLVGGGGAALFSDAPIRRLKNMTILLKKGLTGLSSTRFVEPTAVVYGIW